MYTIEKNFQKYFDKRKVCAAAIRGIFFHCCIGHGNDNKQATQEKEKDDNLKEIIREKCLGQALQGRF